MKKKNKILKKTIFSYNRYGDNMKIKKIIFVLLFFVFCLDINATSTLSNAIQIATEEYLSGQEYISTYSKYIQVPNSNKFYLDTYNKKRKSNRYSYLFEADPFWTYTKGEENLFLTYAKYDEYFDYHKKVFGTESKHKMSLYDIDIPGLTSIGKDLYTPENTVPIQCQYAENTKNCYMKLTKDTGVTGNVTISELDRKDNIITGKASFNSKSEYFEFVYEEKDDNYNIKSLKVIDKIK